MSETQTFPARTWLIVSAALNLLLIGAAIGIVISGARLHRPAGGPGFGLAPRDFMRALPPEKAAHVRERLGETWRASAQERIAARDARRGLVRAVSNEPFDEAGVRAALARVRAAEGALAAKNEDTLVSVLKGLAPDERAAALASVLRMRAAGGPHWGSGGRPLNGAPPRGMAPEAPPP